MVTHFIRHSSDHAPLQLVCNSKIEAVIKHPNFNKLVNDNWKVDFKGSPFIEVYTKMRRVKQAFRRWSKEVFGDTFD